MAKVRSKGNASTEGRIEEALKRHGIPGWTKHSLAVACKPDFYFEAERVLLFVDGCFWHSCPRCARVTPKTRRSFWKAKIDENRRRDIRTRRRLRRSGYRVMRVWEHEAGKVSWISRLLRMLNPRERVHN